MGRILSVGNLIVIILVIIISILLFERNAPTRPVDSPIGEESPFDFPITPFDFYKISFQWPPSYCNQRPQKPECMYPIKRNFTIHGIWPQYYCGCGNHFDCAVPPFNVSGCTTTPPTPEANITLPLLGPILGGMTEYWPNLDNYSTNLSNLFFWKYEWKQHGMCFTNPDKPLEYFKVALDYIHQHNLQKILADSAIVPDKNVTYDRVRISTVISSSVGVSPEIHCNKQNRKATEQLKEIRICFHKNNTLFKCPQSFTGCGTTQNIRFPVAPIKPSMHAEAK